jgi:hypothetical protein
VSFFVGERTEAVVIVVILAVSGLRRSGRRHPSICPVQSGRISAIAMSPRSMATPKLRRTSQNAQRVTTRTRPSRPPAAQRTGPAKESAAGSYALSTMDAPAKSRRSADEPANGGLSVEYCVPMRCHGVITAVTRLDGYPERERQLGLWLFTTSGRTCTARSASGSAIKGSSCGCRASSDPTLSC